MHLYTITAYVVLAYCSHFLNYIPFKVLAQNVSHLRFRTITQPPTTSLRNAAIFGTISPLKLLCRAYYIYVLERLPDRLRRLYVLQQLLELYILVPA